MWPQEKTEERPGEAEFIILTGARHRRLSTPHWATGKDTRVVRRQEIGGRGRWRPWPLCWNFWGGGGVLAGRVGKGKAGQRTFRGAAELV